VELPSEVKNEEELESYLPEAARLVGVDSAVPFTYLIKVMLSSVAFGSLTMRIPSAGKKVAVRLRDLKQAMAE